MSHCREVERTGVDVAEILIVKPHVVSILEIKVESCGGESVCEGLICTN
jgi:hypothetical protein